MRETIHIIPGEAIINEGEESSCMYLLKEGTLAVYKDIEGEQKQIGTIYSGEFVGEVSFLDKRTRCATVKAITDCELEIFDAQKFNEFIESRPKWLQSMMKTLADRLRSTNEKIKV
ncbi:Crp/Fnr family transcriptional regulator [Halobacteriovorax sp. DA5]|uniref:Crp/Fnr family transcriptional regulator n=1 Tax=Halobacteriovorax sp. DA5 TaxID=2067553 RepID=UPI000CD1E3BD|nr:cyclic nucleotide-binding domain-containing protein [Halobacteriovorax sp. DA5]POB14334.1 hypothetical protein C0Z22_04380 [Halobacteriovorax sp. DA5]